MSDQEGDTGQSGAEDSGGSPADAATDTAAVGDERETDSDTTGGGTAGAGDTARDATDNGPAREGSPGDGPAGDGTATTGSSPRTGQDDRGQQADAADLLRALFRDWERAAATDGADGEEPLLDLESVSVDTTVTQTVSEAPDDTVATVLTLLGEEIARLDENLATARDRADELETRLSRKQADFQNYKQRQKDRLEEEKARATEDLVTRLLDVRDNLQRALDQDESVDIRDGIETTLDQFDRQFDREGVERIEPDPGDSVDPRRHEALVTVASDQPADTVARVHRPGYEMAGKVLRPAQVAVSDGTEAADNTADEEAGNDGGTTVDGDTAETSGADADTEDSRREIPDDGSR